jgi:hypothetical protein
MYTYRRKRVLHVRKINKPLEKEEGAGLRRRDDGADDDDHIRER